MDSDSDDSFLEKALRKRKPTRRAGRRSDDRILLEAMSSSRRTLEQRRVIAGLKREATDMAEDLERTKSRQVELDKKTSSSSRPDAQVSSWISRTGCKSTKAVDEAIQSQQKPPSVSLPFSSPLNLNFPTAEHAIEALQHTLISLGDERSIPPCLQQLVLGQAVNPALALSQLVLSKEQSLSLPVTQWLIIVSCSETQDPQEHLPLEQLSTSAHSTLCEYLLESRAKRNKEFIFALEDLSTILEKWFGINSHCSKDNDATKTENTTKVETGALSRLLQLWDVSFRTGYVDLGEDLLEHAANGVCSLMLVSLGLNDSMNVSQQIVLQDNLHHLFRVAKIACRGPNRAQALEAWMVKLADRMVKTLSEVGPFTLAPEIPVDKRALLCHSRVVGMVLSCWMRGDSSLPTDLPYLLSRLFLEQSLKVPNLGDFTSFFEKWDVPVKWRNSTGWKALALGTFALQSLGESNSPGDEDPLCLGVVEVAHCCLQVAFVTFDRTVPRRHQIREEKLRSALQDIGNFCESIVRTLSKGGMTGPISDHLSFYVSCIRQYPRLSTMSKNKSSPQASQTTLKSWINTIKTKQ